MKQYVYLLILPIMFLISCSDDTVEEMGGSNQIVYGVVEMDIH